MISSFLDINHAPFNIFCNMFIPWIMKTPLEMLKCCNVNFSPQFFFKRVGECNELQSQSFMEVYKDIYIALFLLTAFCERAVQDNSFNAIFVFKVGQFFFRIEITCSRVSTVVLLDCFFIFRLRLLKIPCLYLTNIRSRDFRIDRSAARDIAIYLSRCPFTLLIKAFVFGNISSISFFVTSACSI